MGVRLVLGRAGTGKTRRCFDAIVAELARSPLGPMLYWIVPRQATFEAERQLTCASGLPGFCRARVVSFDMLSQEVLEECGGGALPQISSLGRQMILGRLLRQHEPRLRFFNRVARHPGLPARIDSAIAELERCGKGPDDLHSLLGQIDPASEFAGTVDPQSLADKLHDLELIYGAYVQFIGQDRIDPRGRMQQFLDRMEQSPSLQGAMVWVDGFAEFDEFQRRILARLGHVAERVEVTLLLDPDSPVIRGWADPASERELSLFHHTEDTYRRLMATLCAEQVEVHAPVLLREVRRFAAPALGEIERCMFGGGAPNCPAEGIELLEAPDRRAEVDAAARRILGWVRQGLRYREIAVTTRRLDLYADLLAASFHEHGIPHFVDRRRGMAHHPLMQFLRACFAIASERWPNEGVMALCRSGLAGLSLDEADSLENYVRLHRLRGSAWTAPEPWAYRRHLTRESADGEPTPEEVECAQMDALRRGIVERVGGFAAGAPPRPLRDWAIDVFALFDRFAVGPVLQEWIESARGAGRLDEAGEHEQVWRELIELFDQMVDLLGDEGVSLADFRQILEAGLERFDLALAPPTADQVVVGQVDRSRTPWAGAAIVLGLNDGVFPYAPREASVLSDAERTELRRREFDVEPDTERRLLDEPLLAYVALTRASQGLYLSRATNDDAGRELGESPFWRRLREMWPDLVVQTVPRDPRGQPDLIGTPRQLLTALMQWVRAGASAGADGPWPALYQWLARREPDGGALDRLARRAWPALGYANEARLSPEIAQQLLVSPLHVTARQVETFAACPFQHFVRYVLRLEESEDEDPSAIDLDAIYHRVLEQIVGRLLQGKLDWAALDRAEARNLIRFYAQQVGLSLRGELMLSSARNRYLLARIEMTLDQIIAWQKVVAERGSFSPGFSHVTFGDAQNSTLPPLSLKTPAGRELAVCGRIDRVDVMEAESAAAVIDYRLGGERLDLSDVYHGLSLRLLTSLLAIQEHGEQLASRPLAPGAGLYVRLLRQLGSVAHPTDAVDPSDPKFHLACKTRGLLEERFVRGFDREFQGGRAQVVEAHLKQDGTFSEHCDTADAEQFAAILDHARRQLARLGDEILEGKIAISPWRTGTATPCARCGCKSVCRFDATSNRHRFLAGLSRGEAIERIVEEAES